MLNAVRTGTRTVDGATVRVHADVAAMARAAADEARGVMRAAVQARGAAHVMFATGNSQLAFVRALVQETAGVPWADTVVFHMDEYVGVGPDHPAGFQRWIRERIVEPAQPEAAYYVEGLGDAEAECRRYAELLRRPSARPVLPRHRGERAPGLQRPAGGRLRRPARRQGGRARGRLPHAAGERGPLRRPRRRPDPRHHRDHPGAAAGRPGAGHRARGAQGRAGAAPR